MYNLDAPPLSEAVVRVLAGFASRESATVDEILSLAQQLPSALSHPGTPAQKTSLVGLTSDAATSAARPAVPVENSVSDEAVTCLCCGRSFTMLKRHIKAEHDLTETAYRMKFGLAEDHPLVAPNYSVRKAAHAKRIGLGKYERDEAAAESTMPTA